MTVGRTGIVDVVGRWTDGAITHELTDGGSFLGTWGEKPAAAAVSEQVASGALAVATTD